MALEAPSGAPLEAAPARFKRAHILNKQIK
jgi:hypothetical protein